MYKKDYYKNKKIISGFGVDRGSYKHSGLDYPGTKNDQVVGMLDGKVASIITVEKYFGTQCVMMSNPKFANGVDDLLYHSYCHLFEVGVKEGDFVEAGKKIGLMGNSGGSYTKFDEKGKRTDTWRQVTKKEQKDNKCNFGVHLHLWFYQPCKRGKGTKLLTELLNCGIVSVNSLGDTHFYQWDKLIIAPRVIYSYFKMLRAKKSAG